MNRLSRTKIALVLIMTLLALLCTGCDPEVTPPDLNDLSGTWISDPIGVADMQQMYTDAWGGVLADYFTGLDGTNLTIKLVISHISRSIQFFIRDSAGNTINPPASYTTYPDFPWYGFASIYAKNGTSLTGYTPQYYGWNTALDPDAYGYIDYPSTPTDDRPTLTGTVARPDLKNAYFALSFAYKKPLPVKTLNVGVKSGSPGAYTFTTPIHFTRQ